MEEFDAAGHRLAEPSHMLCKGELPVVLDAQEDRKGIAEHSFSIKGEIGLQGRFCTVQAEEGCLAFGCAKCQSRLIRPSDHFIYFLLKGRHHHVLITGTVDYQQIISIGTHKGILLEFGQKIVFVDWGKDRALGQTFLESSTGADGTVHSHTGCTTYERRR